MRITKTITIVLLFISSQIVFAQRKEISLNGIWKIVKTDTASNVPTEFKSKICVPGLVDLANPAIDQIPDFAWQSLELAVAATDQAHASTDKAVQSVPTDESWYYNDAVYWYKRSFTINEPIRDVALLKINKAMYHTRVYLNGKFIGENYYNFTPTLINILPYLKPINQENELIISVGCRNNLPNTVIRGDDFEKYFFTPGIYDDVNIILSGKPYLQNIQTAPDIANGKLRVDAEVIQHKGKRFNLTYTVTEHISGKKITGNVLSKLKPKNGEMYKVDFTIPMPDFKMWSPENPFLYDLNLSTGNDNKKTTFGMRNFAAQKGGTVGLNDKTYYLRGTNICMFRFFEDAERGMLPWNREWAKKLLLLYKDMHWNSMRYTIGPPPELWYDLADSIGFLIQDEYPIWKSHVPKPDGVTSESLAKEYEAWMREKWNHASIVVWDGQNESVYDTTAIAINKVRGLDLSNRPWDNGWAKPASESDIMEGHKYFFYPYYSGFKNNKPVAIKEGLLKDIFKNPVGQSGPYMNKVPKGYSYPNPVIMNEYTWMWLNRDGSPTTVSESIYKNLFPEAKTHEKRFKAFAQVLGMETEYWRSHRLFAGVQYFSALSYSRALALKGITSDNFKDVKNLVFEPYFYKYLRPAFNPVGIMLNFWDEKLPFGSTVSIPVNLINDTYNLWKGELQLSIINEKGIAVNVQKVSVNLPDLGKETYNFEVKFPEEKGQYSVVGEIIYQNEKVQSIRELKLE